MSLPDNAKTPNNETLNLFRELKNRKRYESLGDYHDSRTYQRLNEAAKDAPLYVLTHADDFSNFSAASRDVVFTILAYRCPRELLKASSHFITDTFAAPILNRIAEKEPLAILQNADDFVGDRFEYRLQQAEHRKKLIRESGDNPVTTKDQMPLPLQEPANPRQVPSQELVESYGRMIAKIAKQYPAETLQNAHRFASALYAGDIIKTAAKQKPELALTLAEYWADQPYAEDVMEIALDEQKKHGPENQVQKVRMIVRGETAIAGERETVRPALGTATLKYQRERERSGQINDESGFSRY